MRVYSSSETAITCHNADVVWPPVLFILSPALAPIVLPSFGNCLAGNVGSLYLFTFSDNSPHSELGNVPEAQGGDIMPLHAHSNFLLRDTDL